MQKGEAYTFDYVTSQAMRNEDDWMTMRLCSIQSVSYEHNLVFQPDPTLVNSLASHKSEANSSEILCKGGVPSFLPADAL